MAIIEFSGSFATETEELETLKSSVDSSLDAIATELSSLSECWKDDKSETWLSDQDTNMQELKTANTKVKTEADSYFAEIVKILNIY